MSSTSAEDKWQKAASQLNREFAGRSIKHCWALNGQQFSLHPGEVKACCSFTHDKGAPVLCKYDSPKIDENEFLGGLAKAIRANQTDQGPCVGCRHLTETKIPERFVSEVFREICLNDFWGCNALCVYCVGENTPTKEYLAIPRRSTPHDHSDLFRNLIAAGRIRSGHTLVIWGGGEPTLLPNFVSTVRMLSQHGVKEDVNTSGVRFSSAIEEGLRAGILSARISVDAGTAATYEAVKRNKKFESVWESIKRYAATGGDFVVKYIVFAMNSSPDEVKAFVQRAAERGVRNLTISTDWRATFNTAKEAPKLTLKELEAAAMMRNLAVAKGIKVTFESGIWTPEQLMRIASIGGFPAPNTVGHGPFLSVARKILSRLVGEQRLGRGLTWIRQHSPGLILRSIP